MDESLKSKPVLRFLLRAVRRASLHIRRNSSKGDLAI